MSTYTRSEHAQVRRLDDCKVFAGHPFFTNYVLTGDLATLLMAITDEPGSAVDLAERLQLPIERVVRALSFLATEHFLVTDEQDENADIEMHMRQLADSSREGDDAVLKGVAHVGKRFRDYSPIDSQTGAATESLGQPIKMKVLIVGGCLTHIASDALRRLGPAYGVEPQTEEAFPSMMGAVLMEQPDVVVFQPSTTTLLGRLWDHAAALSAEERVVRLESMKEELHLALANVRARARGALLLVHGFVVPTYSPLGRTEFRNAHHFYRIVYELNQVVMESLRADPNAMFVDEERLLSAEGKLRLMDDALSIFSHHGPIDLLATHDPHGPGRVATFAVKQRWQAPTLFARDYLESFLMWKGIGRIKCVVVDLDNTLWPGLAADDDFRLDEATFLWGTLAGIHQALHIVKQRGALLAVCSRNNEHDVQRAWAQLHELTTGVGATHLLRPDDFVIHKVNWSRKSENIEQIMSELGLSPADILFIDDSAVERAEVRTAFPTIRVLGEDMNLVRSVLLNDHCLQCNLSTEESSARTEMVKAQLVRDAIRRETHDERTFLRALAIHLQVTRLRSHRRLARVVELIQRTNQFNTTLRRLNTDELAARMESGALYALDAGDHFAHYGLVGVCVFDGDEIAAFVMSCRVIPLRAEVPFLVTALTSYGRAPLRAAIVEGPRNQPCRAVYREAQFAEVAPGKYLLPQLSVLPPVDSTLYSVQCSDEPNDCAAEASVSHGAREHFVHGSAQV